MLAGRGTMGEITIRQPQEQELVFEEKRLRKYGTDTARSEQAGQCSDQVDEKNDQIAHRRIVAGRGILRNRSLGEITIRQPQEKDPTFDCVEGWANRPWGAQQ